jgi:hypothetical protein
MPSAIGFPSNPTVSQQYVVGTKTFSWDGTVWGIVSSGGGGGGGDGSMLDSLIKSWWLGV